MSYASWDVGRAFRWTTCSLPIGVDFSSRAACFDNWKSLATNLVKTQENGWQEVDRNNTSFGVKAWPTRPHDWIRAIGGQVMTCKVRVLKQVFFFSSGNGP